MVARKTGHEDFAQDLRKVLTTVHSVVVVAKRLTRFPPSPEDHFSAALGLVGGGGRWGRGLLTDEDLAREDPGDELKQENNRQKILWNERGPDGCEHNRSGDTVIHTECAVNVEGSRRNNQICNIQVRVYFCTQSSSKIFLQWARTFY